MYYIIYIFVNFVGLYTVNDLKQFSNIKEILMKRKKEKLICDSYVDGMMTYSL